MDDVVDNRFGAVVRINVGGEKIVEVARRTLTFFPDSMLGCMFSGRFEVLYDKDGNVFLDRPYKYFSYVIEYLRNGATPLSDLPEDPVFLRRLEQEFDYFAIPLQKEHDGKKLSFIERMRLASYYKIDLSPDLEMVDMIRIGNRYLVILSSRLVVAYALPQPEVSNSFSAPVVFNITARYVATFDSYVAILDHILGQIIVYDVPNNSVAALLDSVLSTVGRLTMNQDFLVHMNETEVHVWKVGIWEVIHAPETPHYDAESRAVGKYIVYSLDDYETHFAAYDLARQMYTERMYSPTHYLPSMLANDTYVFLLNDRYANSIQISRFVLGAKRNAGQCQVYELPLPLGASGYHVLAAIEDTIVTTFFTEQHSGEQDFFTIVDPTTLDMVQIGDCKRRFITKDFSSHGIAMIDENTFKLCVWIPATHR